MLQNITPSAERSFFYVLARQVWVWECTASSRMFTDVPTITLTLPWQDPEYPWCTYASFCYASAPTKCDIRPGNRFCLVKRHIAQAVLSAVSLWRGNDSQGEGTALQIHAQWECICHYKWCWKQHGTARSSLLTTCVWDLFTHTHTRMHTRVKNKACVVERKWCCSCSPDSRAAWHCSSVSLLLLPLQKGCGLIHSAAVFVGRDAILPSFQG